MNTIIIRNNRKSLEPHIINFLNKINVKWQFVDNRKGNKKNLAKEICNINPKVVIFSNGCDNIDVELKKEILKINPNQHFLFSENAWYPYSDYIYFDRCGIGNNSELFYSSILIKQKWDNIADNKLKKDLNHDKLQVPYQNYVLVPLQVDGDSKMIIGSPKFPTVKSFVDYIITIVPKKYKILFKNHPHNKNPCKIPIVDNIIDITHQRYNKQSLIENAYCVMGINSTLLMESIYLNKLVVSFGKDIFSNKGIVMDGLSTSNFDNIKNFTVDQPQRINLITNLMQRQIAKIHCNLPQSYYNDHYWRREF